MAEKLTIFISGTMRDLPTKRARVAAAIQDMGLEPVWAERRGATNRPSHEECEQMARDCHVYLGLYGLSYGWKFPPEETISATEFEWQMARRASKPMLIYRQKGQPDPEQAAFLEKVGDWQQGRFWYEFETLDDLLPRLRDDLARLIAESFRPKRLADLDDYRAHLRRLYADLPLSGIPVPLDVTLPLDRVYIKLRALPEQEGAARRKAALRPDRDEEFPRRLAERLWQQREEGEEAARRLEEAQPIPPEEAIARHDCLAILGEAGAGKSTLLRHLAWEWAGEPEAPLPLVILLLSFLCYPNNVATSPLLSSSNQDPIVLSGQDWLYFGQRVWPITGLDGTLSLLARNKPVDSRFKIWYHAPVKVTVEHKTETRVRSVRFGWYVPGGLRLWSIQSSIRCTCSEW
jgi:hypothetical protein